MVIYRRDEIWWQKVEENDGFWKATPTLGTLMVLRMAGKQNAP